MDYSHIKNQDKKAYKAIAGEDKRQDEGLELIPSENYVSQAVREALASGLTNKYAEGYPGKRYYGGQKFTDQIEELAIKRAKKLFNAKYANVQPLSGAPANLALYAALLEPGDTVLGMDLSHGGHLTHGHPVTFPAEVFNFIRYKMADVETGEIDYNELADLARQHEPKIILAGFSSYPRELDYEKFVEIAREVGAVAVMDAAHIAGLIAGDAHHNPLEHGFDVMTCTTHKTLRGPRGGMILSQDKAIAKKIDKAVFPGLQGGPHMNVVAAKAVAFGEALRPEFKNYAEQVIENAQAMARVFQEADIRLITGGTDNHLLLADVYGSLGVTGSQAQKVLDEVGITVNKNVLPDDERSPLDPSGVRFGTPALTTRGFTDYDCARVAEIMALVLQAPDERDVIKKAKKEVASLAAEHPIPESFL